MVGESRCSCEGPFLESHPSDGEDNRRAVDKPPGGPGGPCSVMGPQSCVALWSVHLLGLGGPHLSGRPWGSFLCVGLGLQSA